MSYRMSKNAVNALTFLQQKAFDQDSRSDIVVNAVHPGFCTTNMTRYYGVLTPQEACMCGNEVYVQGALLGKTQNPNESFNSLIRPRISDRFSWYERIKAGYIRCKHLHFR
ncbi:hypothetical protein J6590_096398 [Homalodisca vitripennis]|nr:hypothetical protein J6590_096398 [Homalodisca vitripennis]